MSLKLLLALQGQHKNYVSASIQRSDLASPYIFVCLFFEVSAIGYMHSPERDTDSERKSEKLPPEGWPCCSPFSILLLQYGACAHMCPV